MSAAQPAAPIQSRSSRPSLGGCWLRSARPDREGLADTPRRAAESLAYLTDGYGVDPRQVVGRALYEHEGDDLVPVRNIPFYALCEHHVLPFSVAATSGTSPRAR